MDKERVCSPAQLARIGYRIRFERVCPYPDPFAATVRDTSIPVVLQDEVLQAWDTPNKKLGARIMQDTCGIGKSSTYLTFLRCSEITWCLSSGRLKN